MWRKSRRRVKRASSEIARPFRLPSDPPHDHKGQCLPALFIVAGLFSDFEGQEHATPDLESIFNALETGRLVFPIDRYRSSDGARRPPYLKVRSSVITSRLSGLICLTSSKNDSDVV